MVCSSAGNAGLAAAYASAQLRMPCHIVIPSVTPSFMRDKIKSFGATVEVYGNSNEDADARAVQLASESVSSSSCFLIESSNHELLWQGHSTIVDEIAEDWNQVTQKGA